MSIDKINIEITGIINLSLSDFVFDDNSDTNRTGSLILNPF